MARTLPVTTKPRSDHHNDERLRTFIERCKGWLRNLGVKAPRADMGKSSHLKLIGKRVRIREAFGAGFAWTRGRCHVHGFGSRTVTVTFLAPSDPFSRPFGKNLSMRVRLIQPPTARMREQLVAYEAGFVGARRESRAKRRRFIAASKALLSLVDIRGRLRVDANPYRIAVVKDCGEAGGVRLVASSGRGSFGTWTNADKMLGALEGFATQLAGCRTRRRRPVGRAKARRACSRPSPTRARRKPSNS